MDTKLSCIHLGHKHIPSREGGIEIVVEELASRMVKRGVAVTCLNRGGHPIDEKLIDGKCLKEYCGIKLKTVLTINVRGFAAMTASLSGAIFAAFSGAEVVHFHAEGPCAFIWIPKLFGKRCIATIHGLDHQRAKWGKFARSYIMIGEKCAVKHADEIIVLSENVRQYFRKTYQRETQFIPNGVSKPVNNEVNLIEKWGLQKDGYILYLGRLVPEKGIQYLIKAFREVKTDKKLVIAGGSSDTDEFESELKQLAREDERIIFTGFVSEEVAELYSNAYFYVLPSDVEGMPLSLLEAMSYGNCCLTSDIPECKEVVEDRAMTFRKGYVKGLQGKVQLLCDNAKLVNQYKSLARDYVCNKYNWDKIVDATLALYEGREGIL